MSTLIEAVQYANYHYYSKPMTKLNLGVAQVPFPFKLLSLHSEDGHEFRVRCSHGILHALAVMELIEKIDSVYHSQRVPGYDDTLHAVQTTFALTDKNKLIELLKVAALFHDAAREGDGVDVWDLQSAIACKKYLIEKYNVVPELAELLSDAIAFKDDSKEFKRKHTQRFGDNIDFIRQLINMADTLEVIRVRHIFKPEYLPIAAYVSPEEMVQKIIPELVVPHRDKVIAEGRLSRAGRIQYQVEGHPFFNDKAYKPAPRYNLVRMGKAYLDKNNTYTLSVISINEHDLNEVLEIALRGIQNYVDNYKKHAGLQFFHDGFFSPRYHGKTGINRAKFYAQALQDQESQEDRAIALYDLLSNPNGPTLKEEVVHSFNQFNLNTLRNELKTLLTIQFGMNDVTLKQRVDEFHFSSPSNCHSCISH